MLASYKELGNFRVSNEWLNILSKSGVNCSGNFLYNSIPKPSGPALLPLGKDFIASRSSSAVMSALSASRAASLNLGRFRFSSHAEVSPLALDV